MYHTRVHTLFWTKNSRTFQGLSRTNFPFFKHSIQHQKEPRVYDIFSSSTTWANLSWRSFCVCSFSFGLDKVSIKIQGLASTNCNFQGLSRPWILILKSRTFKVCTNPVIHIFFTWLFSSAAACESDKSRWTFANLFSSICSLYNASWRYWDNCHISWAWMPFSFCFGANNTYEYYSRLSRWQSPLMHDCIIWKDKFS